MSLCLGTHATHSRAKIWFVSKTLWFTSFGDLDGVFAIFYIKNKWDKYPRLKKVALQEYMKLISRYEVILNWKCNIASKISDIKSIELMVELL